MPRTSTSKRADVENSDFCLPNAVPDFNAVPNNGPSKVRRAAGSLNPHRGVEEEVSPAYSEAESPKVFGANMDFNLPKAVQTFDNVDNIVTLSEVKRAVGSLDPHGGRKEKSPKVLGWRGEDGGMDFVLPSAVPDTVPNIGSMLDRRAGGSNLQGGGKEFTPKYDEANSPTGQMEEKSQNKVIKSFKKALKTATRPFLQKDKVETLIPSELNADSANPNLKDDAGLASPELNSNISPDQRKGFFDRLWGGKVEPVTTPQLKADPAIPDVREVVDLADPRSKTNVGPKKHKKKASKSRPDNCLQSKKDKTVVPNQQHDADPAIPDAMDGADLACPKTEISPDKGKPWKRRFLDCFRKGKVESMPTPHLEADPAIPDVREVVDLAGPQSKTGQKKQKHKASKSSLLEKLQRKKVKTVVPQVDDDIKENPGSKDTKVIRPEAFSDPLLKSSKKKPVDPEPLTQEALESKYEFLNSNLLGYGGYGFVYTATSKSDGSEVAIKQMFKRDEDIYLQIPGYPKPLLTEVALLLKLRDAPFCPYVTEMLEWGETRRMCFLVLEYLQETESLWEFVTSKKKLSETKAQHLMRQAVLALQHCLDNGVFHTDIHVSNFLVQRKTMKLKLIDFGLGHLLTDDGYDSRDFQGARSCTPPEIKTSNKFYAMPTNVWALGVILYFMVHGKEPFPLRDSGGMKKYNKRLSKEIRELINWCLALNPNDRPTFKQILDHEWFKIDYKEKKKLAYKMRSLCRRTKAKFNK